MSICSEKEVETNSLSVIVRMAADTKEIDSNGKKLSKFRIEQDFYKKSDDLKVLNCVVVSRLLQNLELKKNDLVKLLLISEGKLQFKVKETQGTQVFIGLKPPVKVQQPESRIDS